MAVAIRYHPALLSSFTARRCLGLVCGHGTASTAWHRRLPGTPGLKLPIAQAVAMDVMAADGSKQQLLSPTPATEADSAGNTICWTSYWWPVQAIENLNPKVPTHVDLLGKSMVIWGDSKGNWHCMEDKCPHRLAPLSEGRVEKDNIMCCYHGWTFSGDGSCTSIPQLASDPKAHDNACSSKRSCVVSYPTRVESGLLFVWPEAGPEAAARAAASQPHVRSLENRTPYYVRDLPIRFDMLAENLVDPSHVPFSHHGVAGNRNKVPEYTSKFVASEVTKDGYMAVTKSSFGDFQIKFKPPFNVFIDANDKPIGPQFWFVPTKPGWVRSIANNNAVSFSSLSLPLRAFERWKRSFTALDHINIRSPLLDGDSYLLHAAERHMPVSKGIGLNTVAKACYMPASGADAAVIALRKWFQQFGGDVPTCSAADEAAMPPRMPKSEALERYHQHTKQCTHCMEALATLDKVQAANVVIGLASAVAFVAQIVTALAVTRVPEVAAAAAAASMTAASWAGPVGAAMARFWQACQSAGLQYTLPGSFILAVVCYGLYMKLSTMRPKFFFEDYVHAFKD